MKKKKIFPLEDFVGLDHPSDAQISPDGKLVAFVFGQSYKVDKDTPLQKAICLVRIATGDVSVVAKHDGRTCESPRWSPDGDRIAYLSNQSDKDEMQLYVVRVAGGEAQAMTDLRGKISAPMWLPGGQGISFLFDGTLTPEKPPEPDPIVVDAEPRFNRLWIVDLKTGNLRPITPETCHIHEYAWSPDGTTAAVLASYHSNPMQGWYSAQLFAVRASDGNMRQLCDVRRQVGRLTWSPDNSWIAFLSGVMSDEGNVCGEVQVISASGGEPRCVTPDIDFSITRIEWHEKGILYSGRQIDSTVLGWIDPDQDEARLITSGRYSIPQKVSVAQSKTFSTVRSSFTEPPNIYIGSLDDGNWRQLTHFSVDIDMFPPLRVENEFWTGPDDMPVQGFLVYPHEYEAGKRYPLFLHVHGGPSLSYMPDYFHWWERLLAARGCFILMPNPRGSWGRGLAYQAANVGDLGGGDWKDINAGVDHLIEKGLVDPDRMAIGGWSYGGFLVAWAVTQTDRFRCAIAGASITNYESNYGVVLNREWQTTMFGSNVYDETDLHRSRSPIVYVNRVKTPTLLVHGAEDKVAPPQQAIEFHTALRYFETPTQLVLYPREPHGFTERAHQIDLLQRIGQWVDKYLLG